MSADSTPAPWGPPEGLGLKRSYTMVMFTMTAGRECPRETWITRHHATPEPLLSWFAHDRVEYVPPAPGGES